MERETVPLYLGLGTNLGERAANLREALERLDREFGGHWTRLSDFVETEPWGFDSPDRFLNAVVRYDIDIPFRVGIVEGLKSEFCVEEVDGGFEKKAAESAHEILNICKRIEREMGRDEVPEYGPDGRRIYKSRIIDIDILLLGEVRIDEPGLKIPHPLMYSREFVMAPLRQIAPELV